MRGVQRPRPTTLGASPRPPLAPTAVPAPPSGVSASAWWKRSAIPCFGAADAELQPAQPSSSSRSCAKRTPAIDSIAGCTPPSRASRADTPARPVRIRRDGRLRHRRPVAVDEARRRAACGSDPIWRRTSPRGGCLRSAPTLTGPACHHGALFMTFASRVQASVCGPSHALSLRTRSRRPLRPRVSVALRELRHSPG
jgi:hypothetical protein